MLAFIILAIVGLAIYANSFNNQLFWDDDDVITNNYFIKDWRFLPQFFSQSLIAGAGQVTNYWRPLLLVSFSLDYHVWGLNPFGYHLINTILHIIAAWLIFLFLLKISRNHKLSFIVSLLFLIHPLNTEAVTYAAGRADPLSTVLVMLSLIFYWDFRKKSKFFGEAKNEELNVRHQRLKFFFSLIFFAAALLVKEQVIVLPAIILLIEYFLITWDKSFWQKIIPTLPYVFISGVYLALRLLFLNFNDLLGGMAYESGIYNSSLYVRLLTFTKVMMDYFHLLFIPIGLHMAREVAPVTSIFSWPVIIFLGLIISGVIVAVKTWRKNKLIAFGLAWYFIWLILRTNVLPINRPMYEHWLYLPMVGFWLALFSLIILIWEKYQANNLVKILERIGLVVLLIYVLTFSFLTIRRNQDWRDPITFYEKNLRYTPNSFIQHNNLGMAYAAAGKNERAIAEYRRAIAIKDVYAQVHYNLANTLAATGQLDAATLEYKKSISMAPSFQFPYQNLLALYLNKKDKTSALSVLNEMKKNLAENIYFKYAGLTDYYFGDYSSAIKFWRQWLELEPDSLEARQLIAEALNKR